MKKTRLIGLALIVVGIVWGQFSVDSAGNITAHSINLIPPCTGYLYNSNGVLSCNAGTGGSGGSSTSLGPSVSATNTVGQTLVFGVNALSYNVNEWDTGNIHDLTADQTKFIAPSSGYYLASVSLMGTSSNTSFQLFFDVNGANVDGAGASQATASGNLTTAGAYSAVLKLNAGDVVRGLTFSTGPLTTVSYYSTMQMTKLASTF